MRVYGFLVLSLQNVLEAVEDVYGVEISEKMPLDDLNSLSFKTSRILRIEVRLRLGLEGVCIEKMTGFDHYLVVIQRAWEYEQNHV